MLPKVEPEDVKMEEHPTSVPASSETEPDPAEEDDADEGEDEIDEEEDAAASQKSVGFSLRLSHLLTLFSESVPRMHWLELKPWISQVGKKVTRE